MPEDINELKELTTQTNRMVKELVVLVTDLQTQGRQQLGILSTHTLILTEHTRQLQTIDEGVHVRSNEKGH